MRRHVVNAAVRRRRDLRLSLVAHYRTLLESRNTAVASLVAVVVDAAFGLLSSVRARRRRPATDGPRLLRAALGAGDVLSVIVAGRVSGPLGLRRGEARLELPTLTDSGATTTRFAATLPAEAADGDDWSVTIGDRPVSVPDGTAVPAGFTVGSGRLVLRGSTAGTAGVAHTVELGVRTAIVRWPGTEGDRLVLLDGDTVVHEAPGEGAAVLDLTGLTDLAGDETTLHAFVTTDTGRRPLRLGDGYFGTSARPAVPPAGRVTPTPGRTVEVGHTPDGRLKFRIGPATAATWS